MLELDIQPEFSDYWASLHPRFDLTALVLNPDVAIKLIVNSAGIVLEKKERKGVSRIHLDYSEHKASSNPLLQRAIGTKHHSVLDATAGWLGDSLAMHCSGFGVTCIEQNDLVALLVSAQLAKENWLSGLTFYHGNSLEFMRSNQGMFDVVYLDPMFPEKTKKNAAVRKEMAVLQGLLQTDTLMDEGALLEAALNTAVSRVVVKRSIRAPNLAGARPVGSVRGKLVRFDLYAP